MRTRGDGALVIHPIDPDVRASTDTGMSTNLETGSASYPTSTFNDTASATTLSTQTATGLHVSKGEPTRYVVSSSAQHVSVKPGPQPDPSNMDFVFDPKQFAKVVDETGAPVGGLSNGRISRIYFRDGPRPDGANDITIDPISPEPIPGPAGLLTVSDDDANDADDDDHQPDIDNLDDDDNWEDSTPDNDAIADEGIVVPLDKGRFRPPLAPREIKAKRRK